MQGNLLFVKYPHQLAHLAARLVALALAGFRRLLVALMFTDFRHQTRLFTGLRESPECALKRLTLTHFNVGHKVSLTPFLLIIIYLA